MENLMSNTFSEPSSNMPKEGQMTKAIERQTAKIPSVGFLTLAVGSMAASAALVLANKKEMGNFIGLWAPSLLMIGVYNKLVKIEGSDFTDHQQKEGFGSPAIH